MKRKFIFTIGIVLTLAIGAVGAIQYILFRTEQFRLIDHQIESTASLLISSDLTTADLAEFEEAEDIIQDVLGGDKLNQFIVVYGRRGQILYRSKNTQLIKENLPVAPTWQTIETDEHFIRVLSVPLENENPISLKAPRRLLQVGIILDEDLLRWRVVGQHVMVYGILIIVLILITTYILSRSLLRPLVSLSNYLQFVGAQLDEKQMIKESAQDLASSKIIDQLSGDSNDEFSQLVKSAASLQEKIRSSLQSTQAWTAQMAHELKTPLTILQNCIEASVIAQDEVIRQKLLQDGLHEVNHLNSVITGFLEWASVENFSEFAVELHAVKLKPLVEETIEKVSRNYPSRIEFAESNDFTVFAKPAFVRQVFSNLLNNALRYSPEGSKVRVMIRGHQLIVEDHGPGLPADILEKVGQPFNYDPSKKHGTGLGLAWVSTICKKYGWILSFSKSESLSQVFQTIVDFGLETDGEP